MELVESMECLKLADNKADKRNQPVFNTFLKTPICNS
jgi:hypothetical protein